MTSFPISKFAQYFNATWRNWPVSVPYISRHPCLWVSDPAPSVFNGSLDSPHVGNIVTQKEMDEWKRNWEGVGRSDRVKDYVHLPAHTPEDLEILYSSRSPSQRSKAVDVMCVTQEEVFQIRRLIWCRGILPSLRGQIWIHLTDAWDFLNAFGLSEFDLRHEFLDHIHNVTPNHEESVVRKEFNSL